MRFSLPATPAALIPIAKSPETGLESQVFVSPVEVVRVGRVLVNAAGQAAWQADTGVSIPSAGMDLHLRADDSYAALAGNPSVTLNVTLFGAVTTTAVAALAVPSWARDQSKTFPIGQSTDFVPQGAGNALLLVIGITGLQASTNLPANSEWSVWASPAASNFVEIGFKRNVDGPYKVPGSVGIADRYDSAAVTKKGRSQDAELTNEFVHISSMDGMARYNGSRVTELVKIVKDKVLHAENVLYTGYRPAAVPKRGDGDDEVMETSTGPFEAVLNFPAP